MDKEPEVTEIFEPLHGRRMPKPCETVGEAATVSMALSLKRIADALDRLGSGDGLHGLHSFVMNMAYEAGTNFEAGKRRA
jgi:hypothetical protein